MRFLVVAALFGAAMCAQDVTLPLDDGTILIRAEFIHQNQFGDFVPGLELKIKNQTSSAWRTIELRFDIGGLCNGEPRRWTLPVTTSLGWAEDHQVVKEYKDLVITLLGKVDGCKTEIIKASLLVAENSKVRLYPITGERVDLEKLLQDFKAERDAEVARALEADAARAEQERRAAEVQARKDIAEAARRKRMAAEQKQRQVEADARYAKIKAEDDAKAAEERRKIRAACTTIYQTTIDKKVRDLAVREEQQVRACQALSLYPPQ
jgi:hypothetical protein